MIDIREMCVLIVDDMVSMSKSIHKMMRVIGYGKHFFFASNGKEAVDILKKEKVDLVMLDYNMPVMTGGEVLSQMREERNLRDIPVVMITGQAYRDYVAEAAESEIDAYILKPLTIKLLEDKIFQVVEKANNPPPMVYHLKRALQFEDQGDIKSAIREAKTSMKENPNSSRPIRELGYFYFKNNDLKEAEKWLLKAANMNYLDVFAFHYLGEIYLRLNDIENAQDYFEKAMKISPRHLSRGIHFGKTLIQMDMASRATKVFDFALKLAKGKLQLKEEIANFCIKEGAHEYAVKLMESILKERPDRKDLLFKIGISLEQIRDTKKAINYLVKASKEDNENQEINLHLAKNYMELNKPIFAEKALKKVLHINPDHSEAKRLLKKCV